MNEPLPERVARLETENEQCATDRLEHEARIGDLRDVLAQVKGSIRTLVVLWAIVSAAGTIAAGKYVLQTLTQASASTAPVVK